MRIISREEFLELPINTVYRTYEPIFFGELEIKHESHYNDFWSSTIADIECSGSDDMANILLTDLRDISVHRFDTESVTRDGLFNDTQLFAIYDQQDISQLIERLQRCLT